MCNRRVCLKMRRTCNPRVTILRTCRISGHRTHVARGEGVNCDKVVFSACTAAVAVIAEKYVVV